MKLHSISRARRAAGGAVLLAALLSAGALQAEEPAGPETAEGLFQEGKRLFDEGRVEDACKTLARSDMMKPTVSTLGLLAGCHEKLGRIATAWAEYKETARRAAAENDKRGQYALDRAAQLEPELPRLTIVVSKPILGLEVLRDGARLSEDDLDVEKLVDPGNVEILARAPDRSTWVTTVTLAPREHRTVEVPELVATQKIDRGTEPAPRGSPDVSQGSPSSTRVILAVVAGGVGLAGLGVMTGFGLSAASQQSESEDLEATCSTRADCERGRELRDGAKSAATISTVGLAVGVAGLAAGAVLLLTAPASSDPAPGRKGAWIRVTPDAGPRGAGVLLHGAF